MLGNLFNKAAFALIDNEVACPPCPYDAYILGPGVWKMNQAAHGYHGACGTGCLYEGGPSNSGGVCLDIPATDIVCARF